MDKKSLIQLVIISFIIILSISFYFGYFNKVSKNLKKNSNTSKVESKMNTTKNIIEKINYVSEIGENKYQITAEKAEIKIDTPEIMYLVNLVAYITIKNSSIVKVTSNFGEYNTENYDTVFSKNVIATYPNHKITGELLNFSFINNIGIFSTNIVYVGNKTKMLADKIEIDLITNNTKIFMLDNNSKVLIEGIN
tara:strand:- start:208 stop:789 length:582 start_codon:yes stop_codon:yes gene_type:complete